MVKRDLTKLYQLWFGIGMLGYSLVATAIVNVDNLHFQDAKEPLTGSVSLSGASISGNTEQSNVSLDAQVQWNQPEHINLLVLGYDYGKINQQRNVNNAFMHLRHVRHHTDFLDSEFYMQAEENEFTRLNYRGLYGGGVRLTLGDTPLHVTFLGMGGFREIERIEQRTGYADVEVQKTGRWNIYLMSRVKTDRLRFTNTIYWQPAMGETADWRGLFVSMLKVKATDSLSMRLSLEIAHDNLPPAGVEETDNRVRSGIEYAF
ncbi:MAG: DUF481 domain-containing protein [Gammaproteobacteria bacterium]|nr:DUF481 domain-containing protein [Gammaproteobacteria bacterium]MDH5651940.1 DUF481 domain-containing protein [Gammaproteobacteria bacterium]